MHIQKTLPFHVTLPCLIEIRSKSLLASGTTQCLPLSNSYVSNQAFKPTQCPKRQLICTAAPQPLPTPTPWRQINKGNRRCSTLLSSHGCQLDMQFQSHWVAATNIQHLLTPKRVSQQPSAQFSTFLIPFQPGRMPTHNTAKDQPFMTHR